MSVCDELIGFWLLRRGNQKGIVVTDMPKEQRRNIARIIKESQDNSVSSIEDGEKNSMEDA